MFVILCCGYASLNVCVHLRVLVCVCACAREVMDEDLKPACFGVNSQLCLSLL
jgi:hypothetical protein